MSVRWTAVPELERPVLVAGFEGWNDAGRAASDALRWLVAALGATELATVEPEDHVDFQAQRPEVELRHGVVRTVRWPRTRVLGARTAGPDVVLLEGAEPNYHWADYCADLVRLADELDCEMVVTLGALLADTPHTRPIRITGTATDATARARLAMTRSRYEGPTGIVGVLHDAFRRDGRSSVSLWAPVPHYLATPPSPKATRALLDRVARLLGLDLDLRPLEVTAEAWEQSADESVAGDDDVARYVRELEEAYDTTESETDVAEPLDETALPSGEALAADLERFLRAQDEDDEEDEDG